MRLFLISLGVTCLASVILFLYFRNRVGRMEQKVDLMFQLIQEYEQSKNIEATVPDIKKKVLKAGILNEVHERQFFTKKSEKKRLAKSAGRQRWLKKLRDTPGPHQQKTNYRRKRAH